MFEFLIEPFICFLSYISYLLYKCCEFDDVYLLLSPILHEATLFFVCSLLDVATVQPLSNTMLQDD